MHKNCLPTYNYLFCLAGSKEKKLVCRTNNSYAYSFSGISACNKFLSTLSSFQYKQFSISCMLVTSLVVNVQVHTSTKNGTSSQCWNHYHWLYASCNDLFNHRVTPRRLLLVAAAADKTLVRCHGQSTSQLTAAILNRVTSINSQFADWRWLSIHSDDTHTHTHIHTAVRG